ncbi:MULTISPECIES: pentapeptide repeat-containing protein [unclassified Pseudovibrio]|uniref:pentapeptide repeat-containing protein n=1 Tax=unclassified Pseudovibrio TaxID=2627060 RepID=UPI00187D5E02|nr:MULTISPECIES: pentapeptide repeat-containing protein [unclassified Pseudovibrio]
MCTFIAIDYGAAFYRQYPGYFTLWYWGGFNASPAEVLRNIGLMLVAAIGLPFVVWRSFTAHKQAKTAISNLRLAEKGHNNDRFREGAKLLAEDNVAVASSGVFLLADLVRNADEYFPVVQETLEQYVRKRNIDRSIFKSDSPVPDTAFFLDQSAAIRTLTELRQARDWNSLELLDLANTNMDCVEFNKSKSIHFYNCRLDNCSFRGLLLPFANFEGAMLRAVDFSGADLSGANFKGTKLVDAENVRGTYLNCFGIYLSIKLQLDQQTSSDILQFKNFVNAYELAPEDTLNPRQQTHALTRIRLHHANSINRILQFQKNSEAATKTYGEQLIIPALCQIADICQHIPIFNSASIPNASIAAHWSHLFDEDQWAAVNVIS